jgi:hypothetical protein
VLPRLFSSGRAARDEIERVVWPVQSILGLVLGELLVVRSMTVVGFMPVVVGRALPGSSFPRQVVPMVGAEDSGEELTRGLLQ